MASTKKKATAKSRVSFKDLNSKKNPKGGTTIGSATGGAGAGKIKFELKWE
jgi:hypothetical protein